MFWYNFGIKAMIGAARMVSRWNPKIRKSLEGRRDLLTRLRAAIPEGERVVWFHAASLGEFEQGRPVIEALRAQRPEFKILLTFFSPSGYEIRKNYSGADYVFYMPFDTPADADAFVDVVKPEMAVFIKYEFWLNHIEALRRVGCPIYLISAIFRPNSIFFRPWGGAFRRALSAYRRVYVQNKASLDLLQGIGVTNVVVAGDTRFDRVATLSESAPRIDTIEQFKGERPMMVAGSTWGPDEEAMLESINRHPEVKFVIAPHEMDENRIASLMSRIKGGAVRYTQSDGIDFGACQVMIIDTIGILSAIYRYADVAYIGGGFGVGIHNTLEAATYGIPVGFGPRYQKFREAKELIACGAARSVASSAEFGEWFDAMISDQELRTKAGAEAKRYIVENKGATAIILSEFAE